MARFPEPDVILVSSVIGGLPTCILNSRPYNRKITSILVTNTVSSAVNCYRSVVGTVPVATSLLGARNTLRGSINLPAGQPLIIQWSAAGNATARVSAERDDNPLEGSSDSQVWDEEEVTSITLPNTAGPNDPAIVINSEIPAVVQAHYLAQDLEVVALEIYRLDADNYGFVALIQTLPANPAHPLFIMAEGSVIGGVSVSTNNSTIIDPTAGVVSVSIGSGADVTSIHFGTGQFGIDPVNNSTGLQGEFLIDLLSAPRGARGANSSNNGAPAIATTAGAEVAVPAATWDHEPTYAFEPGRLYRVTISAAVSHAAVNVASAVRVRKGSASVAGTIFGTFEVLRANAGFGEVLTAICYIKNTTAATVNSKLSLTIDHIGGAAANVDLIGDANRPCIMAVDDYAAVADRPDIADMCNSV